MGTMTLDDNMLEDLRVAQLGPIAFAVHIAALMYCSRNKTDLVPWERVNVLIDLTGLRVDTTNRLGLPGRGEARGDLDDIAASDVTPIDAAIHCVKAGLWEEVFGQTPDCDEERESVVGFRILGATVREPAKEPTPEPPDANVVPFRH